MRILVVDDDPSVRRLVRRALEGDFKGGPGGVFHEASSVEEALRVVAGEALDLIILDLGFPFGMQGASLLARLREDDADIPVLVVTGNPVGLDYAGLFRLGASDVLTKPFHVNALKHAVNQVLRLVKAARRPQWREAAARVLHVEDTDEWAALVRLWLRQTEYASYRVSDRGELARFLRACRELPDCILLDLTLPDTDGLTLCDELKAHPEYQAIPLVVFTARGDDRFAAMKRRAIQVVVKPDGTGNPVRDDLLAAIDTVIDQSERTRGVYKKAGLRLDPKGNLVSAGQGRLSKVDPAKFAMMRLLLERSPSPVSEEELRLCLPRSGYKRSHPEDPNPNTVAVYISSLRRNVNLAPVIRIVHQPGKGYALLTNPAVAEQ